jgi:two-component system cell cycle sensor histidine kinase/response regulator CckA
MIRRLSSIDWKFPLVMSGLILATAALFVWSAYVQFTGALHQEAGERMRSGARFLAPLVAGNAAQRRTQLATLAEDSAVRRLLRTGSGSAAAARVMGALAEAQPDSNRLGLQVVSRRGEELHVTRIRDVTPWPTWAQGIIRGDSLGAWRPAVEYSPIFDAGGRPVYQVVIAVVARGIQARSDTTLGYIVETRTLFGQGQGAMRELLGAGTFIVGAPDAGVWTDMQTVLDGPPPIPRTDSLLVFDVSPRGPGIGVAQVVDGTPWYVWLQQPQLEANAPARLFIWRIIPVAAAIALLGALVVWLLSREVTNRLVALTEEVDRVEAGQGPAPAGEAVDLETDDEIERLENAFDRMASRVEQQQRLEAQLMQSQKIEAVGRLAGGIAHDFNNVLTVVRNYTELVRADMPEGSDAQRDMDEVLKATERAAGLTRQLLAFSRQQVIAPQDMDVNEVIEGSQRMLTRVIPSNVVFETHLDPTVAPIHADRGQLEQVLLNLTINAVDAMPDGGTLGIRTSMTPIEHRGEVLGAPADGKFVCITVTDTGTGMSAETLSRIFEPFFTTKPVGKGTGLGLPTAHGIVTQSGGHLGVQSEPGKGTSFTLYFPPAEGVATAIEQTPTSMYAVATNNGNSRSPIATVLVVEDDPATREVTRRLLERSGYRILEAEHANAALAKLGNNAGTVDLVLTDVMMPGMSGVDLAARISDRWPALPVLMMSGYSDSEVRAKGALGRQRSLIEKPFTAAGLLNAVEGALKGD